jgi:hypothetical protein
MAKWRAAVFLLAFAAAWHAHAQRRRAAVPPGGVPPAYADLYAQLAGQLAAAEATVAPLHPELQPKPLYAAELLPANANRGPALLQPGVIAGVRVYLDRLLQLGVRGVVFPIGYPLLVDRFPNSGQYLQFYRQVMAEARQRGMTVDIESSVMFANSPFSPVQWDFAATPFSQFVAERRAMTATIVAQLAPDYLDLGAEPDTEAKLTGYAQLNSPAVWAQTIGQIIQGLDRGATKIGTGLGTWDSVAFAEAEAALPVDFIALHIYPIDAGSIANGIQAAAIARSHGKSVIVDEAWLYKLRPGESTSIAADANIFMRDAFDFFAPLDQRFLRFADAFARAEHVAFLSPFWSVYFFAYLPYTPGVESLPYGEVVAQANARAAQAIADGTVDATGAAYAAIIRAPAPGK